MKNLISISGYIERNDEGEICVDELNHVLQELGMTLEMLDYNFSAEVSLTSDEELDLEEERILEELAMAQKN
jgi:hypothetical protein